MKKLFTIVLTTLVLVGVPIAGAVAGVKRIKPSELKPKNSDAVYLQQSEDVRAADTTPVKFWAEVKLPVGKSIKKLTYYHSGTNSIGAPNPGTHVSLWRHKFGAFAELDPIMEVTSDEYGIGMSTSTTTLVDPLYQTRTIKSGYIYCVLVISDNYNSYIHGIEITYK